MIPLSGRGGKSAARRKETKESRAKVSQNWPYPDPFERKQAERRAREEAARKENKIP